jgi:hypothetical protein
MVPLHQIGAYGTSGLLEWPGVGKPLKSTIATLLTLCLCAPAGAACRDASAFQSIGSINTKGGGTYVFGMTVGGVSAMRGTLERRGNGLPDRSFDLDTPYHIDFADAGFVRAVATDTAATLPQGTILSAGLSAPRGLPDAVPGTAWDGRMIAAIRADGVAVAEVPLDGHYSFLAEMQAEIDGCTYRIQPVELTLALQGSTVLQRRVLYFPDLGVSAITRWGPDADGAERTTGITGFGDGE